MAFDSLHAFWVMEGHGPYVWTCYGAFFLVLGLLTIWSFQQRRQLERRLRRQWQLESRKATSRSASGHEMGQSDAINPSQFHSP
ncbi:heme exporter protein CcmD [Marinobacter caseinilyticus]|uniref:heme exporter protein CcmD n=1 Tax=Marinobacter caseinilyticus TaxID=2692195 RepID=UPI00140AF4DF|nr:heme exporter protein CcmD [Marinobacter caseinilyticus]